MTVFYLMYILPQWGPLVLLSNVSLIEVYEKRIISLMIYSPSKHCKH